MYAVIDFLSNTTKFHKYTRINETVNTHNGNAVNAAQMISKHNAVFDNIKDKPISSKILTVQETKEGQRIYYIPHKPVIMPDNETTKLRGVYDASSSPNGNSPTHSTAAWNLGRICRIYCGLF